MVITFKILVNGGLYAYNSNELLVGRKKQFNRNNVIVGKVYKYLFINRAKIIITLNNVNKEKDRKFVIRTSLSNLEPFLKIYGK